jgi:hypothetical protein
MVMPAAYPLRGNPKSECRNPKQSEIQNSKKKTGNRDGGIASISFCNFFIRNSNLFRISTFGFRISAQRSYRMHASSVDVIRDRANQIPHCPAPVSLARTAMKITRLIVHGGAYFVRVAGAVQGDG